MEAAGFRVEVHNENNMDPIKRSLGVPANLESCHTAKIDRYYIEGHVPAQDVKRLLAERPNAAGIAVPKMPIGSPGMETRQPSRTLRRPSCAKKRQEHSVRTSRRLSRFRHFDIEIGMTRQNQYFSWGLSSRHFWTSYASACWRASSRARLIVLRTASAV